MDTRYSNVFIVDGVRTPILKARGGPGPFAAGDLAVAAGRALLLRTGIGGDAPDEVVPGFSFVPLALLVIPGLFNFSRCTREYLSATCLDTPWHQFRLTWRDVACALWCSDCARNHRFDALIPFLRFGP